MLPRGRALAKSAHADEYGEAPARDRGRRGCCAEQGACGAPTRRGSLSGMERSQHQPAPLGVAKAKIESHSDERETKDNGLEAVDASWACDS